MEPLITILLTTYNRAHLIGETLDSIIAQTYTNWECIIVDDNSIDNTEVYLREYYLSKDARFSYYKKDLVKYKKGLGGSRNQSLDIAKERKAEYIHFFDDDDLMHSEKLKLQLSPFLDDDKISFTTCEYKHLNKTDDNLSILKTTQLPLETNNVVFDFVTMNNNIHLNSCGPLWKANFWKTQRFNEDLKIAEEYVAYCELFINNRNIVYRGIPYVLFFYRKHMESNTAFRYESYQVLESKRLSDELVFNSLVKKHKMTYPFLAYYTRKYVVVSFDHYWYKKINDFIHKEKFKGKLRLRFIIFTYMIMRRFFLKLTSIKTSKNEYSV